MSTKYQKDKHRLQATFNFSRMPFIKNMWAKHMFESESQTEMRDGLSLWTGIHGLCLVCGPNGAGKSITLRRFRQELSEKQYEVFYLCTLSSSQVGFFRSLCRALSLPVRQNLNDMYDAIASYLGEYEQRTRKHPIIIIDDADNLTDDLLEALRRLTNFEMDREDRFSLILSGESRLGLRIKEPQNLAVHQRITYAHYLRGFSLEDTRRYIAFHLERADGPPKLFQEAAMQLIFQLSKGYPRVINQIAVQSLIQAAIRNSDVITDDFIRNYVLSNPLFDRDVGGPAN